MIRRDFLFCKVTPAHTLSEVVYREGLWEADWAKI